MFSKAFWDRIGIGLSGFCAIHCLFFPVIVALMPLFPVAETVHYWTHPVLFLLIVPTVYFAVRNDKLPVSIPIFLYSGLFVIALAWMLHEIVGSWGESLITMAGSGLLITGHWQNYRYHQKKHKSSCEL